MKNHSVATPNLSSIAQFGYFACVDCGPTEIVDSEAGDLFKRCAKCGRAGARWNPPSYSSQETEPPRKQSVLP
jgi:hypothetical protein